MYECNRIYNSSDYSIPLCFCFNITHATCNRSVGVCTVCSQSLFFTHIYQLSPNICSHLKLTCMFYTVQIYNYILFQSVRTEQIFLSNRRVFYLSSKKSTFNQIIGKWVLVGSKRLCHKKNSEVYI